MYSLCDTWCLISQSVCQTCGVQLELSGRGAEAVFQQCKAWARESASPRDLEMRWSPLASHFECY